MRLSSYLVPDGEMLRLYDHAGNRRLTVAEAEKLRADEEARQARIAKRRATVAEQRATLAEQQAQILADRLRSLGIDHNQFL
jgi:protein required for attachment to host cells